MLFVGVCGGAGAAAGSGAITAPQLRGVAATIASAQTAPAARAPAPAAPARRGRGPAAAEAAPALALARRRPRPQSNCPGPGLGGSISEVLGVSRISQVPRCPTNVLQQLRELITAPSTRELHFSNHKLTLGYMKCRMQGPLANKYPLKGS